jgi:hypothetical protein
MAEPEGWRATEGRKSDSTAWLEIISLADGCRHGGALP